jgi:hypothetical protein
MSAYVSIFSIHELIGKYNSVNIMNWLIFTLGSIPLSFLLFSFIAELFLARIFLEYLQTLEAKQLTTNHSIDCIDFYI